MENLSNPRAHSSIIIPNSIHRTMNYSSDEEAAPVALAVKEQPAKESKSSTSQFPTLPVAIAGIGAIVVGIGARFLLGRRKSAKGVTGGAKSKLSSVPKARRAPPRRPRSVASSVDGSGVKRYVDVDIDGAWWGRSRRGLGPLSERSAWCPGALSG